MAERMIPLDSIPEPPGDPALGERVRRGRGRAIPG